MINTVENIALKNTFQPDTLPSVLAGAFMADTIELPDHPVRARLRGGGGMTRSYTSRDALR